jgi:hypothetical protein
LPSANGVKVGEIVSGTDVYVYDRDKSWYYLKAKGVGGADLSGWVNSKFVRQCLSLPSQRDNHSLNENTF